MAEIALWSHWKSCASCPAEFQFKILSIVTLTWLVEQALVSRICLYARGIPSANTDEICAGGLLSLWLFVQRCAVDDCLQLFELLARHAFTPRTVLPIPVLSDLQRWLVSCVADSLYSAEGIECALKRVFGTQQRLVDPSWASRYGIKIILPATVIPGNVPYLFSNRSTTLAQSHAIQNKRQLQEVGPKCTTNWPTDHVASKPENVDEVLVWEV